MSTPIPVSGTTQDTRTTLTQSAGMLETLTVYFLCMESFLLNKGPDISPDSYIKPLFYKI